MSIIKLFPVITLISFLLLAPFAPVSVSAHMQHLISPSSEFNHKPDLGQAELFVDDFFARIMPEHHIPGAVFVLVKDGRIEFAKGYGYADLRNRTPMDPQATIVRVQSISKLFTSTAVLQLQERGLLNLNADVNTYLSRFKIPQTFTEPITLAQLLTHTSGLDQVAIGVSARTAAEQQPLGDYLALHLPQRIMPPGVEYSYNNYGMSLAGYVVEQVSGMPYADYVERNILQPLDMQHSSFLLRPALAERLATEYVYHDGIYQPVPFDYLNTLPAGGLNTTATDIAHFMLAHLQNGQYSGHRILGEETTVEMHRRHFTVDPQLPGIAYGFHELRQNGVRALEQGGTWAGSTSELVLFPDQNLGYFMSYTRNDEPLRDQFTTQFLDRFFPTQHSTAESTECRVSAEPSRLAGSYRPASFNRGDLFKIGALLYEYQVTTDCDCRFTLHYPSHHAPTHWIATAPLRIQRVSPATDTENDTAVFQADSSGAITHLFIGTRTGLIKLQWYETANLQFGLVGLFLLAFISAGPVGLGLELKRISRKSARPVSRGGLLAQWILILYGWLAAVLLIGLCIELFTIDPNEFNFGIPLLVQLLLRIPILLMALTVGLFIGTGAAWKFGYWSRSLRVLYGSIALIATVSLIFLRYWNLLPV